MNNFNLAILNFATQAHVEAGCLSLLVQAGLKIQPSMTSMYQQPQVLNVPSILKVTPKVYKISASVLSVNHYLKKKIEFVLKFQSNPW